MGATPIPFRARNSRSETDPITLLTSEERAYIGGLIDGEGCIRVGFVGPRKDTLYLSIAVGMTNREVIEWLRLKLSSGNLKVNNRTALSRNSNWKPQYLIRIHGKRAKLLCATLLPYLIVKRAHALLALDFPCDARIGPAVHLSEEVKAKRRILGEEMRLLNLRGRT